MAAAGAPELYEGQAHLESTVNAPRAFLSPGAAAGALVDPMALIQGPQLVQALAVVQCAHQRAPAPTSRRRHHHRLLPSRNVLHGRRRVECPSKSAPQVAPSPNGGSPATGSPSGTSTALVGRTNAPPTSSVSPRSPASASTSTRAFPTTQVGDAPSAPPLWEDYVYMYDQHGDPTWTCALGSTPRHPSFLPIQVKTRGDDALRKKRAKRKSVKSTLEKKQRKERAHQTNDKNSNRDGERTSQPFAVEQAKASLARLRMMVPDEFPLRRYQSRIRKGIGSLYFENALKTRGETRSKKTARK